MSVDVLNSGPNLNRYLPVSAVLFTKIELLRSIKTICLRMALNIFYERETLANNKRRPIKNKLNFLLWLCYA